MAWNLLRDPLVSAFLVLKSQMHVTLPGLGRGFWGANSGPCTVSTSLIELPAQSDSVSNGSRDKNFPMSKWLF